MADGSQRRSELYCGPDLAKAAERSNLDRSLRDRYTGLVNGLGIFVDTVRHRPQLRRDMRFELATTTGVIRGTQTAASVVYAGNGSNRDWCVNTTISDRIDIKTSQYSSPDETIDDLRKTIKSADIVFVDGLDENLVANLQVDFVRVPAWVKQRVRVADDWSSQIRSLRRGTRQEISRILRKYGYECRLTSRIADISRFYDEQYQPYISSLYGKSAIIVDRDRFTRECKRGVLLQLSQHEAVVASALLRPVGRTMAIVWTGMNPQTDKKRIPGATDALDYFGLLYAYLKGCRWLDFGPSRADLYDGTLQYKNKWGSEITAGHFKQPSIYWTCNGSNEAVRGFLRSHAYVSNQNGELAALIFREKSDEIETLLSSVEKLIAPGISECRVISLSPIPKALLTDLKHRHPKITMVEAESVAEAIRLAS